MLSIFLLSIDIDDFIFFIALFFFLSLMNIKLQIDDLSILDWDSKDGEYKLDLNYLYVSPNFIPASNKTELGASHGQ